MSRPAWARGLKLERLYIRHECHLESRPAWARGLKRHQCSHRPHRRTSSRPAWARGLKLVYSSQPQHLEVVAPRVGAWIETMHMSAT